MSDAPSSENQAPTRRTDERDELRTLAFRMREIQRLLAMRVEQENRRLESEGLEPVTEAAFSHRIGASKED